MQDQRQVLTSGTTAVPIRHRCAVWGSPIAHSLSPVLHSAAYEALGLEDWSYERREVDEAGFAVAFGGLDDTWRGLSLTMPLKEVALRAADDVDPVAAETGAANTLVRGSSGWSAHNTDVHGIVAALREAGCPAPSSGLVVGSGATARSAVAALASLGARRVTFAVRAEPRPETVAQARRAGLDVDHVGLGEWPDTDVVVSTVPPSAVVGLERLPAAAAGAGRTLLDVVYGDGETPLQAAATRAGWTVVGGLRMLLHQATEQVRLMTGLEAPVAPMDRALAAALDRRRTTTQPDAGAGEA